MHRLRFNADLGQHGSRTERGAKGADALRDQIGFLKEVGRLRVPRLREVGGKDFALGVGEHIGLFPPG